MILGAISIPCTPDLVLNTNNAKNLVARAGFAPAFRGYEPLVLSYATTAPQLLEIWSGWQELNLRGHAPKACGWPLPYTRTVGEGVLALSGLPLHTNDLAQRVHDVDQIALCLHDGIDRLVRHRSFVDDIRVLTAFDACGRLHVIFHREATLRLATRHGPSRSMTAAHEPFRVALATHDVRACPHTAGDDSHVSLTRTHCALPRDEHVLAVVVLPSHVVVMAAHHFYIGLEHRDLSRTLDRCDQVAHHQIAIGQGVVLRPVHRADVVLEVLRALRQVGEILVRQIDHPLTHVVLRQLDEKRAEAIAHAS